MKLLSLFLVGLLAFGGIATQAGSRAGDLSIRSDYHIEEDPLTTDRVGSLDPEQVNPQKQNWLLNRVVQLAGVTTRKLENGNFGVNAEGLLVTSRGYLRANGSHFQKLEDFPCGSNSVHSNSARLHDRFNTYEGAKVALAASYDEWLKLFGLEKIKLSLILERLDHKTDAGVRELAEKAFRKWLRGLDQNWRDGGIEKARAVEWAYYLQEVRSQKVCQKARFKEPQAVQVPLDPPSGVSPKIGQILARIPARLWNGFFSIRVDFVLGDRSLNGRFLIDPGAPRSVISPTWLENQGVYAAWVATPELPPLRVRWGVPTREGAGMLANWAHFDHVRVSGLRVPVQDFLLVDTDFFAPPQFVSSCCDGVLGIDFLRSFPMEFQAEAPAEVRVWPRENFTWGPEVTWKEIYETKTGLSSKMPIPTRGKVTLDLPHGRLWTSQDFEDRVQANTSGLGLIYKVIEGDRALVVIQIKPGSPAAQLMAQGLRVGTVITQIDSKDPADLDLWQVGQRLAGVFGNTVTLQWQTRQGDLKMAPLSLKSRP